MNTLHRYVITATSYGGSHSGTVNFVHDSELGTDSPLLKAEIEARAESELRDSGYRTAPLDIEISEEAVESSRKRPSWDAYFMKIAHDVAERSTCLRLHVGCVTVKNHRILTTGYNGAPRGVAHCDEVGCKLDDGHCQRAIHAEINTIAQAALHGVSLDAATLYVTHQPCRNCTKAVIAAGIKRVVFAGAYPDEISSWLCNEANVSLEQFPA